MNTSKINLEDLPQEIQDLFDKDDELEFESLIPDDLPSLISSEGYVEGRMQSARKMLKHRKYSLEMKVLYEKYESGKLDGTQAKKLMERARQRYEED